MKVVKIMYKKKTEMPWDCLVGPSTEDFIFALLSRHINKSFDQIQLLDFGAGSGRYLDMFAKKIPLTNLWGAEVDHDRIRALKVSGYNSLQIMMDKASLSQFGDETFDIVFSSNVLEHIPYRQYKEYLNEINRILLPNGIFMVGMPNYPFKRFYDLVKAYSNNKFWKYYLFDDPTHINKISIKKFAHDLKCIFPEVHLRPSYAFLQGMVENYWADDLDHECLFSLFCDKYFGYAKKNI